MGRPSDLRTEGRRETRGAFSDMLFHPKAIGTGSVEIGASLGLEYFGLGWECVAWVRGEE